MGALRNVADEGSVDEVPVGVKLQSAALALAIALLKRDNLKRQTPVSGDKTKALSVLTGASLQVTFLEYYLALLGALIHEGDGPLVAALRGETETAFKAFVNHGLDACLPCEEFDKLAENVIEIRYMEPHETGQAISREQAKAFRFARARMIEKLREVCRTVRHFANLAKAEWEVIIWDFVDIIVDLLSKRLSLGEASHTGQFALV